MKSKQQASRQGVSNQFNTAADGGIGPLSKNAIRSRLTADLFFEDQMCIPGTSLLCNPATFKIFNEDIEFLVSLLSENKLVAILQDDTPSFSALADKLVEVNSAAILTSGQKAPVIREVAELLDQYLIGKQIIRVNQATLDKAKTETSQKLIRELRDIVPLPEKYYQRIVELASNELDKKGAISGSWWVNIAKKQIPEIRAFDNKLTELGNIVFDFSYTNVTNLPLVGHPYDYDVEGFSKVAQPFVANYSLEILPGVHERRDIDSSFFDNDVLAHMDMENFSHLRNVTRKQRERYYKALGDFRLEGSLDSLFEAKERLDEYLLALAKHVRSFELTRFAKQQETIKRINSQILVWQAANVLVYSFAIAGGWHEMVKQTLTPADYGLFVLAGLGTLGAAVTNRVSKMEQHLKAKQQHEQEMLKKGRPASIHVLSSV